MSDDSSVATIAISVIQILSHFFQVLRSLFLHATAACSTLVIVLLGPALLIAMLFQPSGLGDRYVLSPEFWHQTRILPACVSLLLQSQRYGSL